MKVLIINHVIPQPDRASGCRRLVGIVKLMSLEHSVDFVSLRQRDDDERYRQHLKEVGAACVEVGAAAVKKLLVKNTYDIIFFEFYFVAQHLIRSCRRYQPQAALLVDSVDVHFQRWEAEAKLGKLSPQQFAKQKADELAVYQAADLIVVVSEQDGQLLAEEGIKNWKILGNIVPTSPRESGLRGPDLLFVGGFGHPPNVDGVQWFLDHCWARIKEKCPTASFRIAGGKLPAHLQDQVKQTEGVEYLGYVPDLEPVLDRACVSVAPLRYGGGVKGKVNEAMACGVPLVTTSIGVQGIAAQDGIHCFIADDPELFADRVLELLKDSELQVRFSAAAQGLAERTCGEALAKRQIKELLQEVSFSGRPMDLSLFRKKLYYLCGEAKCLLLRVRSRVLQSAREVRK